MHSQRWMFTSPGGENEYKRPSTTREHYDAVVEAKLRETSVLSEMDRKMRDFESAMWEKMTKRALEEKLKEQEDFAQKIKQTMCSSYKKDFAKEGFTLRELGTDIDQELEGKYSLYTDTAKTFYVKNLHGIKAKDTIHKPLTSIYKKDDRFTSRLSNPMDMHCPAAPGHYAYV